MAATPLNNNLLCIKYLLCSINALFMLTGVMIMSVGITIYNVYQNFEYFMDPNYVLPATILIIVGGLIFVIVFFGCYGAIKESTCMVSVFTASLSVILVLEVAAAIIAYTLRDSVTSFTIHQINETIYQYSTSSNAYDAMNHMQSQLGCCGTYGVSDWKKINEKHEQKFEWESPLSCCADIMNYRENEQIICVNYESGCAEVMAVIVERSAVRIVHVIVAVALIQFSGIMFAWILGRSIRRQKTERERRRWELRENLIRDYRPMGKSDLFTAFPNLYVQSNVSKPVMTDDAS